MFSPTYKVFQDFLALYVFEIDGELSFGQASKSLTNSFLIPHQELF
jgi:hypothetical protein